jgi:excinuclease ABC subunit A
VSALDAQTVSQMVDQVLALPEGTRIMMLAPVVTERKGEHLHVFKELLGNGFIRARIDGMVDLDTRRRSTRTSKHTIEAVVDRLRCAADMQQRLAESFETALRCSPTASPGCGHGRRGREELIFSAASPARCAATASRARAAPVLLQQPGRGLPDCDGLGVKQFFDPELVVQDEDLTLAEGAIRGWDRRNVYYFTC